MIVWLVDNPSDHNTATVSPEHQLNPAERANTGGSAPQLPDTKKALQNRAFRGF